MKGVALEGGLGRPVRLGSALAVLCGVVVRTALHIARLALPVTALAFSSALVLSQSAAAAPTIILQGAEGHFELHDQAELLEDTCACLSPAEVLRARTRFQVATRERLNIPRSSSAFWLRFEVQNPTEAPMTRWLTVLPAYLHEVSLLTPKGDVWQVQEAGIGRPFGVRALPFPEPAFILTLMPHEYRTYLLRVASETALSIVPELWVPSTLREKHEQDAQLIGSLSIMYPMIFGLCLLLYAASRRRSYLYLLMCAISHAFYVAWLHGHSFKYLWPSSPTWAMCSGGIFGALAVFGYVTFVRLELETKTAQPRVDRLLLALLAATIGAAVAAAIPGHQHHMTGLLVTVFSTTTLQALAIPAVRTLFHKPGRGQLLLSVIILVQFVDIGVHYLQPSRSSLGSPQPQGLDAELFVRIGLLIFILLSGLVMWINSRRARSDMFAYIGHDLRAPVGAILEATKRLPNSPDNLERNTKYIEAFATHQLQMIDELVELSADDLHDFELVPVATQLPSLLRDIAQRADPLAAIHGNQLRLEVGGELPAIVVIDERRLRQVVMNLLSNAAKFTRNGLITLSVKCSATGVAGECALRFTVSDTGSGISSRDIAHIFKPWRRGANATRSPGSGLGLAIARRWVRAMGGAISVATRIGAGSIFRFSITVPLGSEDDLSAPVSMITRNTPPLGRDLQALIAEDHRESRTYLQEILLAAEYEVLIAADGAHALELLERENVDLLITDHFMDGLDGWELLHAVKQRHPAVVAILNSNLPPKPPVGWHSAWRFDAHVLKQQSAPEWYKLLTALDQGKRRPARKRG